MDITKEMIEDCVSDLSINGKYCQLYEMITTEVDTQISTTKLESIIDTLIYVGFDKSKINEMSKLEILFEYSKLI